MSKHPNLVRGAVLVAVILVTAGQTAAQRYMERMNRGLVAVSSGGGYFVSWRLLGTESTGTGFNLYKGTTKLNASVLTSMTCYQDNSGGTGAYTVRPVVGGVEGTP